MIVRKMEIKDIPFLRLDADWMRDRYKNYIECEIGPSWVIEDNNKLICAFGIAFLWNGVGEVWYNLIERTKTISQIRIVKKYLDEQIKELNIKRMHATTRCTSLVSRRFIEKMGFKCETPFGMRNYNPDNSDAYLFSRVF